MFAKVRGSLRRSPVELHRHQCSAVTTFDREVEESSRGLIPVAQPSRYRTILRAMGPERTAGFSVVRG